MENMLFDNSNETYVFFFLPKPKRNTAAYIDIPAYHILWINISTSQLYLLFTTLLLLLFF